MMMEEKLSRKSFESLTLQDVQNVPESIWDELFDAWWADRLRHATLYEPLKQNKLEDIMRREVKRVIVSGSHNTPISCTIGKEEMHGKVCPLSSYERKLVHCACEWLGMTSTTDDFEVTNRATITISGKYCQPDDLALITLDQAIKDGARKFVPKKRRRRRISERKYECDACGECKSGMEIAESVFHRGRYCFDCLEEGACETDPEYGSKWEPLAEFLW